MLGHTVIYLCKSGSKKGSFCIVDTQKKIVLYRFASGESTTLRLSRGNCRRSCRQCDFYGICYYGHQTVSVNIVRWEGSWLVFNHWGITRM